TTHAAQSQLTAAFIRRLAELGWIEGRTVAIEYRWAEGRSERFAELAAELVRLTSMLSSRITPHRSLPQNRQHRLSRSCLRRPPASAQPGDTPNIAALKADAQKAIEAGSTSMLAAGCALLRRRLGVSQQKLADAVG